eukprot:CAMPEP_0171671456 /NCGR_PEP_ID=MMETSP0990-20121206/51297_1 /TAXON_ID=483369 /ORGANISM="non described non described, Strain CCMP2098" /LENGTH=48 /DNA_ID= /DNA_START= /DNA_END= /DNA_ORIENTATION=
MACTSTSAEMAAGQAIVRDTDLDVVANQGLVGPLAASAEPRLRRVWGC